jgi:hypothetical protein
MQLAGVSEALGKACQVRIDAIIWASIFNAVLSLLPCVELRPVFEVLKTVAGTHTG